MHYINTKMVYQTFILGHYDQKVLSRKNVHAVCLTKFPCTTLETKGMHQLCRYQSR